MMLCYLIKQLSCKIFSGQDKATKLSPFTTLQNKSHAVFSLGVKSRNIQLHLPLRLGPVEPSHYHL